MSFGDCQPIEMKLHVLIFGECGVDWLPSILYNLITFAEQFGYRVYPIIAWPIQACQTVPILLSVGINITQSNVFRKTQILSWLPIPVNILRLTQKNLQLPQTIHKFGPPQAHLGNRNPFREGVPVGAPRTLLVSGHSKSTPSMFASRGSHVQSWGGRCGSNCS